jgi:hypothetical protein
MLLTAVFTKLFAPLAGAFAVVCLGACKPGVRAISNPHHTFGATSVDAGDFRACNGPEALAGYDDTIAYLAALKNHIAAANGQTFRGVLAPKNICVALDLMDLGTGGGAFGNSGRFEVERATVRGAANDAEVAAVLCHEMAHIAMNHLKTAVSVPSGEMLDFTRGKGAERYYAVTPKIPS